MRTIFAIGVIICSEIIVRAFHPQPSYADAWIAGVVAGLVAGAVILYKRDE